MCVSESMKLWLKGEWGIDATVVYDRPPDFFKVVNVADMHNLMMKLKDTIVLQDQVRTFSSIRFLNFFFFNFVKPILSFSQCS